MSSLHVVHVCWTFWEHKWPATKLTRASAWLMPPWYALYSPPVSLDLTHPPQQIWQTRLHYCNVGQHSGQICKFDLQRCCLKLGMTTPQNDQWGCCFGIIKNAHCPYQKVTLLLETHSQLSPDDQNKKWISVTAPVHCNGWTLLVCLWQDVHCSNPFSNCSLPFTMFCRSTMRTSFRCRLAKPFPSRWWLC